jgi:hypothetical protein
MKVIFAIYLILASFFSMSVRGQEGASSPMTGIANASSKTEAVPVNLYTGAPGISIPLYNYSHQSGLNLNMTLDYSSGGIRVNETPTPAGLGWSVNVGGAIVRTIRGLPDDYPRTGFMHSGAIPPSYHSSARKYYVDSLDSQQDVFQFSINGRSGKFYIGKNKQIVIAPLSKIRIGYLLTSANLDSNTIKSFYIIAEDGIKYIFNTQEKGVLRDTLSTNRSISFTQSWYLSLIVSPFSHDTIYFTYKSIMQENSFINKRIGLVTNNVLEDSLLEEVSQLIYQKKISSIKFPDGKKISFIYDPAVRFDRKDIALNSIQIKDSIFRYGYKFYFNFEGRTLLDSIKTFTATSINPGYKFEYYLPHMPRYYASNDTIYDKTDHWGFYNAIYNGSLIFPKVSGVYSAGADRSANSNAIASSLSSVTDPSGGITFYKYENNDAYRVFDIVTETRSINIHSTSQTMTPISTSHISNSNDLFTVSLPSYSPTNENYPFSGSANLVCSISNVQNDVEYASFTLSLYTLFNTGTASFTCNNLPTGNYLFKTHLSTGTTITPRSLYLNVKWHKEVAIPNGRLTVGGIRIKQISHLDPITGVIDTISTYKYNLPSGISSGFLGTVPVYHFPFLETQNVGIDQFVTSYHGISSQPYNNLSFVQGSSVGYKRVEVIKGSELNNNGKEVYEFTNLEDVNSNLAYQFFPYPYVTQRDWGLGLPKKVSIYDNTNRLVQQTVNEYNIITIPYTDSNFTSLKLGHKARTYNGSKSLSTTSYKDEYEGAFYSIEVGRADLTKTTQTIFHKDLSSQSSSKEILYDVNYNPIVFRSSFDKTKNLTLERRVYYPYHYSISDAIGKLRDSSINTVVSTEDWILGDNNPRLINASITDFQEIENGQIKPISTYALVSNKPISLSIIGQFSSSTLVRNTNYFKEQKRFTKYDIKGNCLELKEVNANKNICEIMDYDNLLSIAKVANASYSDIAYTSFESDGKGNWTIQSNHKSKTSSITGKYSYDLDSGNISKATLNSSETYLVTYWKKSGASVSVNNITNNEVIASQNGWDFISTRLNNINQVIISGSGLIDELRIHPINSNMVTYTYEPMVGVTSICDQNNSISYNVYDSLNRLVAILDKDKNIVKKYEFSDKIKRRNQGSPYKVYYGSIDHDPFNTNQFLVNCFYYWKDRDGIMGEEHLENDKTYCPRIDEGYMLVQ